MQANSVKAKLKAQTLLGAGVRHWKERLDGARTGT